MAREYVGIGIRSEFSSVVSYARTDLSHYLDVFEKTPPALFRNRSELNKWIEGHKLSASLIKGSNGNIIRVHGKFEAESELVPYSQLWAKASYKGYRKPWANYHAKADKLVPENLRKLHADHVINKGRIRGSFSKAWVMLYPVPESSNRTFGAMIEKRLSSFSAKDIDENGYPIDGLVGFKIYSTEYPRTVREMEEQLTAIAGQVPSWFHQEIASAIRAKWNANSVR